MLRDKSFYHSMNINYFECSMIKLIVIKVFQSCHISQSQIDVRPYVHLGATTQAVNEKEGMKAFLYMYFRNISSHCC